MFSVDQFGRKKFSKKKFCFRFRPKQTTFEKNGAMGMDANATVKRVHRVMDLVKSKGIRDIDFTNSIWVSD